jgi:hypothetical protein
VSLLIQLSNEHDFLFHTYHLLFLPPHPIPPFL